LARAAVVPSSPSSAILQTRRGLRLELFAGQRLQNDAGSRLVRQERLDLLWCNSSEDSSGLASFSAWTLLDKMNHSFLSSLAQKAGVVESFVFADSVLSWNTAHEVLVNFVGGGPSRK